MFKFVLFLSISLFVTHSKELEETELDTYTFLWFQVPCIHCHSFPLVEMPLILRGHCGTISTKLFLPSWACGMPMSASES
jgi:hypothetical protein